MVVIIGCSLIRLFAYSLFAYSLIRWSLVAGRWSLIAGRWVAGLLRLPGSRVLGSRLLAVSSTRWLENNLADIVQCFVIAATLFPLLAVA
jgi:hypothetical protein